MNTNYLIIPGYGNSGPEHWQSYFEKKLRNCYRVQQYSWEKPNKEDWVVEINKAVQFFSPESVVLISHSLGGIALAHWAKKYQTPIKAAMIVAPPNLDEPYQDLGLESFLPIPMEPLNFPTLLVASDNDHWASEAWSKALALKWSSDITILPNAGHINTDAGYGEWHEGLSLLHGFLETI